MFSLNMTSFTSVIAWHARVASAVLNSEVLSRPSLTACTRSARKTCSSSWKLVAQSRATLVRKSPNLEAGRSDVRNVPPLRVCIYTTYLSGLIPAGSPPTVDAAGSTSIRTSWSCCTPHMGSWLIPGVARSIAFAFAVGSAGTAIRSGGPSSSLSGPSSSSSLPSSPSSSPCVPAPPWLALCFFRRCRLTTSLKRAYRKMSSAADASLSSTLDERRALAWAVARRMSVSSVRAVSGEV